MTRRSPALLLVLLCVPVLTFAAQFPAYSGFVNDYRNLLSVESREQLEQLVRGVEADTTAEIAVAIVTSLDGMTVEDYANRLFREWGVGKESVDNGVLIVVAPSERAMRIEVGYGLEPVLPDGLAAEVIRTNFLPHFREDRYEQGINEGVARVAEIVRRNHVLSAEELAALDEAASNEVPLWVTLPFFGLFVGIGSFMAGVGVGSKTGFPLMFGSLFAGIPFLMSLVFNSSAYVLGPLGVAVFIYGFRTGRRKPMWVTDMRSSGRRGGAGSGWVMGASSSSSGGSSSGSSSGSSFGGGSSGGGGASGRW